MAGRYIRGITSLIISIVSMSANAIVNPCVEPFTPMLTFSPAHPGPDDVVYADFSWVAGQMRTPNYVRADVSATGITVDVVASTATDPSFLLAQGFTSTSVAPTFGLVSLGTFAAGTYPIQLTAGTYAGGDTISPACGIGTFSLSLVVLPQSAPVQTAAVVEYYDAAIDHYFITQWAQEIAALDGGLFPGWVRTGKTFRAYIPDQSDNRGRQVCRFYATPDNRPTHFLAASSDECAAPIAYVPSWQRETTDAFEIALPARPSGTCPADTVPVYRLWNGRVDSDHRYTTDIALRDSMVAMGYIAEGYGPTAVAMCAPTN